MRAVIITALWAAPITGGLFILGLLLSLAAEFRQCGIGSCCGTESVAPPPLASTSIGSGITAAHRALPFGTMVRVVDLRTECSVAVRINDRGAVRAGSGDRPEAR